MAACRAAVYLTDTHVFRLKRIPTVRILNKVYETGRKHATGFKQNMQIVFDEYLPKWNYRAVPECT